MKKETLTYSMTRAFQTCRMKYDYRYKRGLVPVESEAGVLTFGSAMHGALEAWLKYGDKKMALLAIQSFDLPHEDALKVQALFENYIQHWNREPFEVIAVEQEFCVPLVNAKTKRTSRTFNLRGKVDGIVRMKDTGGLFILEHKTCANITDEYLSRVLIDTQIAVYADAISRQFGEPVSGAIYDIIQKPTIHMKKGETEEEFETRRAELLAKSKTGKTTAKRQMPETDEEFIERLNTAICAQNFVREVVTFTPSLIREHQKDLWAIANDIRSGILYKNTGSCSCFGRACEYLPLCRCNGDLEMCDGLYKFNRPHEELSPMEDDNE